MGFSTFNPNSDSDWPIIGIAISACVGVSAKSIILNCYGQLNSLAVQDGTGESLLSLEISHLQAGDSDSRQTSYQIGDINCW